MLVTAAFLSALSLHLFAVVASIFQKNTHELYIRNTYIKELYGDTMVSDNCRTRKSAEIPTSYFLPSTFEIIKGVICDSKYKLNYKDMHSTFHYTDSVQS